MLVAIKRSHPLFVISIVGIIYIILTFLNPYKSVHYGDVGLMYVQIQDIIDSGYSSFALQYKGEDVDPEYKFFPYKKPFLGEVGNKHYFVFPPYFLFINAFLYQIFGINGLYLISLVSFVSTLLLIYEFGLQFCLDHAGINLSILLYVFGMTASNYNFVFHELPFAIFAITLSIYFANLFFENQKYIFLLLFGFFGGASLFLRLECIFIFLTTGLGLLFIEETKNFLL